ncbi:prostate stem cell antigen [Papio anubis]|uniref:prostate stem cell antigen n=1 Tax=Papio anubis TaxID=9555 RepID=UPI0012ADF9A4|nr:prostate stem cell antigen [Papio anubis]
MKAVLLALLMAGLALQPGTALLCYSCKAQVSNEDCLNVENCRAAGSPIPGSRCSPGAVGLLTVISKGCSSNCVDDSQDYYVGKKNITCCDTDLCNASGAHALQPAAAILALLPALSLLLWGPRQL